MKFDESLHDGLARLRTREESHVLHPTTPRGYLHHAHQLLDRLEQEVETISDEIADWMGSTVKAATKPDPPEGVLPALTHRLAALATDLHILRERIAPIKESEDSQ